MFQTVTLQSLDNFEHQEGHQFEFQIRVIEKL
jgi:hypothetical protein